MQQTLSEPEMLAKIREAWKQNRSERDQLFDSFPLPFQNRIIGFRQRRANAFWQWEDYEFFVCNEAIKIIYACSTLQDVEKLGKVDVKRWKKTVPTLDIEHHTPATLVVAWNLAYNYRQDPESVAQTHSAMCPVLGCETCGCWATVAEAN